MSKLVALPLWMKQVALLLILQTSVLAYTSPNPNGTPVIVPNSKTITLSQQSGLPNTVEGFQTTTAHDDASSSIKQRKKWGVDTENSEEYWFDKRIHTLGNIGLSGALHAAMAPISTKIIDLAAYDGVDIRAKLAKELSSTVYKQKARVADLCCGVGCSTRALKNAFPDADVFGVDTSPEMVAMAEFISHHVDSVKPFFGNASYNFIPVYKAMRKKGYALKKVAVRKAIQYLRTNAEDTQLPSKSFDLVTLFYAFHEAPHKGRDAMLMEARRLLAPGGTLAVVDISTDFTPSESMLKGEPYVQEYQKHIHNQIENIPGFDGLHYRTIVPKHLGMWTLKRSVVA